MSRAVNDVDRRFRRAGRWVLVLTLAFVAIIGFLQIRYRANMAAFRQLQLDGTPASRDAAQRFEVESEANRDLLHIRDVTTARHAVETSPA